MLIELPRYSVHYYLLNVMPLEFAKHSFKKKSKGNKTQSLFLKRELIKNTKNICPPQITNLLYNKSARREEEQEVNSIHHVALLEQNHIIITTIVLHKREKHRMMMKQTQQYSTIC